MQQKLFFFLMFLFGVSNTASSLDMRRTGASLKGASSLSNVATLSDIVLEKPNEAFLPEQSEVISYDISFIEDVNDTETTTDAKDIKEITKVDDIPAISSKVNEIKPINEKKEISQLRDSDMVKKPSKRNFAKLNKKQPSIINDKFSNIEVKEGEEVLVSTSTPTQLEKTLEIFTPELKPEVKKDVNIASTSSLPSDENPFGVIISTPNKKDINEKSGNENPFIRAFSALKPEKVEDYNKFVKSKKKEKTISFVSSDILKKDLQNTYLSDNKFLSPVESLDEEYFEDEVEEKWDEESEEYAEEYADDENFDSQKDVKDALEGKGPVDINSIKSKIKTVKKSSEAPSGPLKAGTREVLQMKIDFQDGSSAVSGESVNLIRSFAQIATEQPTNSIEITIPESVMNNPVKKKLIARRLSIVSNILRNTGISDRQIQPVLSDRDENSFAFRVVSNDKYGTLRVSKGVDMFGEDENVKEYNIMKW